MQLGPKAIMGVLLGPPLLAAQPLVERVQAMEATTSSDDDEGQKHLRAEILAARRSIVDDVLKIVGLDGKQFLGADLEVLKDIAEAFAHAIADTTCFVFSLSKEPDQLSQWRAYAKDGVCIVLR